MKLPVLYAPALLCLFLVMPAAAAPAPVLENQDLRVEVDPAGAVRLLDKQSGVTWPLGTPHIVYTDHEVVPVKPSGSVRSGEGTLSYAADPQLEFHIRLESNPPAMIYSFSGPFVSFVGKEIQEVQLIRRGLAVGPGEANYYAVPNRMGVRVTAEGDKPYGFRLPAYQTWGPGYSMAMLGAVKEGSALLVTWDAPYTELMVDYTVQPRQLTAGLALRDSARTLRLQPLGRGGYVEIAGAYRSVARRRGLIKPLAERVKENPGIAKLFGAADIKPFTFIRQVARGKDGKDRLEINFTFDEAAALAEHLRRDLDMDRAMLILAGWIRRGYDNQHPDILPAAPELGGNPGLADCSRRTKALGWIFGLHDNYQDLYQDAPSWSQEHIIKNPDGSMLKGGAWAGGQCYLICSRKGLELAMRPQNLPAIQKLFAPWCYFIDTTYAVGPRECSDPKHPLDRNQDIAWKSRLSDKARDLFGLFGSECGREWALPHSDFFEGLVGVGGRSFHNLKPETLGAKVIPFWEMIYHDCQACYGKYGYAADRAAGYVAHHVLAARPLHYHSIPDHRYWTESASEKPATGPDAVYLRTDRGWAAGLCLTDVFLKNTHEVLGPLAAETAHERLTRLEFLSGDGAVRRATYGQGDRAMQVTVNFGASDAPVQSSRGGDVLLPAWGFTIDGPKFAAFYAKRWGGRDYPEGALFTLQAVEGPTLERAPKVRVFHGFGDPRLSWQDSNHEVPREKVITR